MARRRHVVVALALALALGVSGVARAAAPGNLDPSFGSGGVATVGGGSQLFGVAVQSGGEVIAAGQSSGAAFVERLTTAGQPDASFGSGGHASGPAGRARAVALQSDGKVVLAGTGSGMFVMRLNANGTADTSFGSGGVARAFGGSGAANAIGIQPDGKIVVAGSVNPIDTRIAVARFNSNGSPDTSFGSGGTEVLSIFNLPYEAAQGLTVQPDGKIVLVGYEQGSPFFAFYNGLVIRLSSNGALDPSFNGSGVVSYHKAGSGYDTLNAVTLQNDGKIVAAGADVGGPYAIFLRLNANGSDDSTFGSSGEAALSSGTATSRPFGAYGVGIGGGGRVVGAGAAALNGTDLRAGLWATTSGGAAEPTFGNGGIVEQQTGAEACGLAVARDGSLIAVGQTVSVTQLSDPCIGNGGPNAFVARYTGFGPPPPPIQPGAAPAVSTGAASGVSQNSATIAGQVNPNGLATTYEFEYGTSTKYGSATATGSVGAGTTIARVSVTLNGLSSGTTYHYRIDASNSAGTSNGQDATFTTPAARAPSATTGGARTTEVSATISGEVDSNGLATSYRFDYGRTAAYRSRTSAVSVPAGSAAVGVSARLGGLHTGTIYHYRLVATNVAGTSYGAERTFKTTPRLTVGLHRLARSYRVSAVASAGLPLKVTCNQACSVKGSLIISAATAQHLRLGKHHTTIGSGSAALRHSGTAHVRLRLTRAAKRALGKLRSLSATLRIVTSPVGGGATETLTKRLTLKR